MKVLTSALAALVFLQVITCAVPYNTTMGQYNVSFDIDSSDYSITENPWKSTESLSGTEKREVGTITVRDDHNREAVISIAHYDEAHDNFSLTGKSDTATTRTIDGVLGEIDSKKIGGITLYWAFYYPAFDPEKLEVNIASYIPWNEGTLQLLKTIHVERTNETS